MEWVIMAIAGLPFPWLIALAVASGIVVWVGAAAEFRRAFGRRR